MLSASRSSSCWTSTVRPDSPTPDPTTGGDVVVAGNELLDALAALGAEADALPCRVEDADLWFADTPGELERAKALCQTCPVRALCFGAAVARREPWGVWGGSIFDQGVVIERKRPRGRPRKDFRDTVAA